MTLFIRKESEKEVKTFQELYPLTLEKSKKIYDLLLEGLNCKDIWIKIGHENDLKLKHCKDVKEEAERIELLIMQMMSGNYLISPIEYKLDENGEVVYEEIPDPNNEGEVIKNQVILNEAVYFIPTTEKALISQIRLVTKNEFLDVAMVAEDVRMWSDGNPDESPSFIDWIKTFKTL
jgi:hypothetical protein